MRRRTTEIRQSIGGPCRIAGETGPKRGSTRMTKTKIHGRCASVPRHRGVGGVGGRGLRCQLPPRLPWAPRACRSARHHRGTGQSPGVACRRRSEAVRRRLRRRWTARGSVRRRRRLPRGRHPPYPGGVRGRHGVHGGGADANRRRPDDSSPLGARRSPRRRCDSPTIPRRWYGRRDASRELRRRDASRELPRPRRSGRMSLGRRRLAQRSGDRRRPHWAARHGHPRGVLVPGHHGGHADADGRDDRRPPRLRPHLREIRRSRHGVRQTARQRGRAARHRGCAAADRRRGCAVADLRRGVVVAERTVRPRRRPCVGDCHRGFRGQTTAPYLWQRLWRWVPPQAAGRDGEQGVGRAEVRPIRSRPVRPQDHPSCLSAAAVATWGVAAASPAALAAVAEWLGGKARSWASRRAIRRARPRGRGTRDPT